MSNWEPIETAPTTGRQAIWLWRPDMDMPQKAWSDTWWVAGFSAGLKPTHWMWRSDVLQGRPEPPEEPDPCPECGAPLVGGDYGSGVKCSQCDYWFCY